MKAHSKILSVASAAAVALALFVTANARVTSAHRTAASLPTLRFTHYGANKGKPARTLDPALITLANDADTIAMVMYGLVYVGVDNKVHLGLAQKYTVSKNRKVYTFTLRKGLKYANGHRITASHIRYAVLRSLAPSTASDVASTYLPAITGALDYNSGKGPASAVGVKVLNSSTVQFTLIKPYSFFLKTLTYSTSWPLDPAVVGGKTASATGNFLTNNCPGNAATDNGPFKFQCSGDAFWPAGSTPSYTFVPNPRFYGPKPKIKVVAQVFDTVDTQYKTYKAGGIDVTGIPSGFIAQESKNKKEFLTWATSRVYYFSLNFHKAPFTDVHCRLAFAYGIDRAKITHVVLHDLTKPIYDIVPPGFLGYYSGKDSPHYNVAKAKSEFSKCGTRSTPVKLVYPTGSADNDNQYNEVAAEGRAIGFNMTTNPLSANDWGNVVSQLLDKTNTQATQNGWQQDYPDPQDYVTLLLRCGSDYDVSGYCDKTFVKLVDKADVEGNSKKRAALYIQAQKRAISQGAWITYTTAIGRQLHKPCVHGLVGTVAYANVQPINYDWSKVTKSGKC